MIIPILADASLPGLNEAFPAPFKLTRYHTVAEIPILLTNQDILLCRSTLPINQKLIKNNPLKIIATASSGIDHIDSTLLAERNIHLIDAKGSNAISVADYVLFCLAYLKKNLGFKGKKAGIIGSGAVGTQVAARLQAIGFEVINYDPPRAQRDPHFRSTTLSNLMKCDLLCIHANRHHTPPYPSIHLLNKAFLKQLRPNTVILNAARGGIVNEEDLLHLDNPLIYCTDVYEHEPFINPQIIQLATLCTPHIAGHSIEAKLRAVTLISEKLHTYYHLPLPLFSIEVQQSHRMLAPGSSWENTMLSFYNPWHQTQQLKNATITSLSKLFQDLRQAHKRTEVF